MEKTQYNELWILLISSNLLDIEYRHGNIYNDIYNNISFEYIYFSMKFICSISSISTFHYILLIYFTYRVKNQF